MSEGHPRSEDPGSIQPLRGRFGARALFWAAALIWLQRYFFNVPLTEAATSRQGARMGGASPITPGMETGNIAGYAIGIVALFMLHALFAAAETALRSVGRGRLTTLAEDGNRQAAYVLKLLEHPASFLTAIQVLKTTLTLCIAVTTLPLVRTLLTPEGQVNAYPYAAPITVLAIIFFLLLFGEIVPKVIASQHADRVALFSGWWIGLFTTVIYPLFRVIDRLSLIFVSRDPAIQNRSPMEAEEEIKIMAAGGVETGEIEPEEQEMIRGVLTATDKVAREVMVPRIDITAVDVDSPVSELVDAVLGEGHSRIPIYDETIDRIIGIVHARDLLHSYASSRHQEITIRDIPFREPKFIPENKRLLDLLGELRQSQTPLAIVVDEYGGTSGLVTIEDLIEEIVGEIKDESDIEEEPFQRLDERTVIFASRVPIEDVNELMNTQLPEDEFDTIGGFVFGQVGHLPTVGKTIIYDGVVLTVDAADGHRIQQVRVYKDEEPDADEEELVEERHVGER